MNSIEFEFYGTPDGDVILSSKKHPHKKYEESDRDFTSFMIDRIREFYPSAYNALCKEYEKSKPNRGYFEYLMVHRFIRCNFKEYDSRPDVDINGSFRFEFVSCPMRGECRHCNIICNPTFNSRLSPAEKRVMSMLCQRYSIEQTSEALFISINTVKKHKRNALERLGMHSFPEFLMYANKNRIFEND